MFAAAGQRQRIALRLDVVAQDIGGSGTGNLFYHHIPTDHVDRLAICGGDDIQDDLEGEVAVIHMTGDIDLLDRHFLRCCRFGR